MGDPMLFERRQAVAILSIDDAPLNRMSADLIDVFEHYIREIEADDSIRAVVLTAAGTDNFSVGMDLKQLDSAAEAAGGHRALFAQRLRLISRIENMGKPWIATMFGHCLGGGLEVPLGCHFRFAADEGARIGLPEAKLGGTPGWGGTARLAKCVGRDHALDIILRAKMIDGPTALAIGLVHEIYPMDQLKQKAIDLAEELAAKSAAAVRGVLEVVVGSEDRSLHELIEAEQRLVEEIIGSPDEREGMQSFLEKRPPVFNREGNTP